MYPQSQFNGMDALTVLSLLIGYENLVENRQQSAHNDVQAANDNQAQFLLQELKTMFQEQNAMLEEILGKIDELSDRMEMMLWRVNVRPPER